MSLTTRHLHHTITRWVSTPDTYGGNTFSDPEHLKGRWTEQAELTTDSEGNEIVTKATVILAEDVELGDWLYWGESEAADPTQLNGAYQVKDFRKITDLRNMNVLRKAIL